MNDSNVIDYKNIYYPPGGILIWIVVIMEVFTFMMALSVFVIHRSNQIELFNTSRQMLNPYFGLFNTIVLVTGGYFMTKGVDELKIHNNNNSSSKWILMTIMSGILFIFIKSIEYYEKIQLGIGIEFNDFFTYYWLLTIFHYVHVLLALIFLVFIYVKVKTLHYSKNNILDVETAATFWHMCDLIWLLLFPILYLLH